MNVASVRFSVHIELADPLKRGIDEESILRENRSTCLSRQILHPHSQDFLGTFWGVFGPLSFEKSHQSHQMTIPINFWGIFAVEFAPQSGVTFTTD